MGVLFNFTLEGNMFLYTVLAALSAIVAGILIAVCTKKSKDISYGKLDKIGRYC